eukprot:SAG31_NODE_16120_length_722_cov_0.943820_2_plen_95_part_01
MDIGKAVEMIKEDQRKAERDPLADVKWNRDGAVDPNRKPVARRPIMFGPIKVSAHLFGEYTNLGMFVGRPAVHLRPPIAPDRNSHQHHRRADPFR